jgi:formylglycine-generating enzyme required for sulfatase activity
MVMVKEGRFEMGSAENDPERQPWEGPKHRVDVPTFLISEREVTVGQWRECVREKGCPDKTAPPQGDDADLPVVRVSWDDAQRYAAWLSKKSPSRTYRLPTEAEWEFSARGGSTERYWWKNGRDFDAKHVSRDGRATLGSLGGSRKNLFGLYDVTGNVAEWVQDCYMNTYTKTTSADAVELPGCQKRVVRGGSWRDGPSALRITARSRISATLRDASIGFRIAATEVKRGTEQ